MSVFGGRNGWYQSDEKKFKDSGTIYIDDVIDRQVAISLFSFVFFFVVVDWILLLVMSSSVFAVPYSDYSFAVFGDTKDIKDDLRSLGGKFNKALKHEDIRRPGWIVSKKNENQLEEILEKHNSGVFSGRKPEKKEEKKEETPKKQGKSPFLAQYTAKSIVVFGDSREFKSKFKSLGGKFNPYLTFEGARQAGWLFKASHQEKLEEMLGTKLIEKSEEDLEKEQKEREAKKKEREEKKKKEEETGQDEKKEEVKKRNTVAPYLVKYSEKSLAVLGDSRDIKTQLKALGGRFNGSLKHNEERHPGWIFKAEVKEDLEKLLKKRKRDDDDAPPPPSKKVRKIEEEDDKR